MRLRRAGRAGLTTLFDRYVIVDWSASGVPRTGRDSIWVAALGAGGGAWTGNPPTRTGAAGLVQRLLRDASDARERVLVGFDFPYAFPRGFAAALGLPGEPWRAIWAELERLVRDDRPTANASNRFAVASALNARLAGHAFWGRPAAQLHPDLSMRKDLVRYRLAGDAAGLAEWRDAERRLREAGRYPQPVWKLAGAGSVGSQALTGIPVVSRLRHDPALAPRSVVWPFEVAVPGPPPGRAAIVHAEIWPGCIDVPPVAGQVRDQTQVIRLAEHLRAEDRRGALGDLFAAASASEAAAEEGWILGVPG